MIKSLLTLALLVNSVTTPLTVATPDGKAPTSLSDEGRRLASEHKYYAATGYCYDAFKITPKDADVCCALADCYFGREFYDQALKFYRQAEKLNSERQDLKLRTALCLSQLKQYKDARRKLRSAKEGKSESAAFALCSAFMYFNKSEARHAAKEARFALKKDASLKSAITALAMCYAQTEDYSKALEELRLGLEQFPKDLELLGEVGNVKYYQGEYGEANDLCDQMIAIDPEFVDAYKLKGLCLEKLGRDDEALACYKQLKGLDKGDSTMSDYIIPLLFKQGQYDEAAPYVVSTLRKTADTEFIVNTSTRALGDLPAKVRRELLEHGCRVFITPTLLEFAPDLAKSAPSGYPEGEGWDYVGAYYDRKYVMVSERRKDWQGHELQNYGAYNGILHELGHAYDALKESESRSKEFKECYEKDCRGLNAEDKAQYGYFLQEGQRGREELFATLFETYVCRYAGGRALTDQISLKFPLCYDYVFRKLE